MLTNYDKVGWEEIKVVLYSCGMHPKKQVALKDGLLNEITFVFNQIFNIDEFHFNCKYDSGIHLPKEAIDSSTLATDEIY